jgi:putative heme-binding domain-containing protein
MILMNWLRGALCATTLAGFTRVALAAEPLAENLQTLPDFKLEVLLKADKTKNGSWISLTKDPKGRLLIGGQRGQVVTRVTLEDGKVVKEEALTLPVSEVMGMRFVDDVLYASGAGKNSAGKVVYGLWRLRGSKDDGSFSSAELLREWQGGAGEHGAHQILLGPDKKLYIACGNFVDQPTDVLPTSPHRNYADDRVLPRAEDGNGFGSGKKPPGGSIFRMDLDGKNCELYASGDRNTYSIAFNPDGELLGFDSDMEWDWGTPWYRPIRIYHATSGADMGFREGTAKWPAYYEDSLPPVMTVGLGSPTGVIFGAGLKFPSRYQKTMYVLDWTYGRLIAAHLVPNGSSYEGTWENFVAPKSLHASSGKTPFNLTGVEIGNDGALYFVIGGRNTQSYLYRVSYTGSLSTEPAELHDRDGAEARALRHKIESLQSHEDPTAIETVWPYLDSNDRFLRYAARLVIERQPVDQWKGKALAETRPQAALDALLALARLGGSGSQKELFAALDRFPLSALTKDLQLEKLRVIEVSMARQGKPSGELAQSLISELDPLYPNESEFMNRELCQILLALDAPDAVSKTVALLDTAPTQEEQIGYILFLRTIKNGWTPELRKDYFSWWNKSRSNAQHPQYVLQWFADVGIPYNDGSSFPKFLANFHTDAEKTLTDDDRKELASILAAYVPAGPRPRKLKPHAFVQNWRMADIQPLLGDVGKDRNFARGRDAFEVAQCNLCHRMGNAGGSIGPDLTAVSSRFQRRDILESILEPSKVVSEQYMNTAIRTKSGDVVIGRIVEENANRIIVQPDPLKMDRTEVKTADVEARKLSPISPMPEGLVSVLSKDEILDLIAYLEAGGRRDHPDFSKATPVSEKAVKE